LAIKVMNKMELVESDMQNQLIQEIKTQSYCNHPNILKLYACFSDAHCIYLLLELGTHHSLFHDLKHKRYFAEETSSYWMKEVCAGVGYLHRNNIIHRDIKPENIINCFGVLKLCDFGWAIYSPI
jgi:serine/threonine protein kinase